MCLSGTAECTAAYVRGQLEKKCEDELIYTEDKPLLTSEAKDFIEEVSRGYLTVSHLCKNKVARIGLYFVKKNQTQSLL